MSFEDNAPERISTQRAAILERLRRGAVTNIELQKIGIRYSARICELRKMGYSIATKIVNRKDGITLYELQS